MGARLFTIIFYYKGDKSIYQNSGQGQLNHMIFGYTVDFRCGEQAQDIN